MYNSLYLYKLLLKIRIIELGEFPYNIEYDRFYESLYLHILSRR